MGQFEFESEQRKLGDFATHIDDWRIGAYSPAMPNRSSKPTQPRDLNQLAASIVGAVTGDEPVPEPDDKVEPEKNPHAAALGKLGGKKGGPARALRLNAERRSEIAKQAAEVRWRRERVPSQGS